MRTAITHIIDKVALTTLTFEASDTEKSFTFSKSGLLRGIITEASNWTNAVDYGFTITNEDGTTLKTTSSLVKNATTYTDGGSLPIHYEEHTLTVTLAGAPGAGGATVGVTLLLER